MEREYYHIAIAVWLGAAVSLGLAENYAGRPTLAELNETVEQAIVCGQGVLERDEAVDWSESFFPYCGPGQSYFCSLQHELEELATQYVDHVSGPLNAGQTDFLYFTPASWHSAAGLNTNGFRRATESGGEFSYGYAQAGDMIGAWIFEDIEKGYQALRHTMRSGTDITEYHTGWGTDDGGSETCCGNALNNYHNNWSANSYQASYSGVYRVAVHFQKWHWLICPWQWGGLRVRGRPHIEGLPTISRGMDVYCMADVAMVIVGGNPPWTGSFLDIDGILSGYQENKLNLVASYSSSLESYTGDWIGSLDDDPIDTIGWDCSTWEGEGEGFEAERQGGLGNSQWLLKWDFTYPKGQ